MVPLRCQNGGMITKRWAERLPLVMFQRPVRALKLSWVTRLANGGAMLVPVNDDFPPFIVDRAYCRRENPKAHGFYLCEGARETWCSEAVYAANVAR